MMRIILWGTLLAGVFAGSCFDKGSIKPGKVIFVIDGSGSVREQPWKEQLDAVISVLGGLRNVYETHDSLSVLQWGVMQFSVDTPDTASNGRAIAMHDATDESQEEAAEKIRKLIQQKGDATVTKAALTEAREQVKGNCKSGECARLIYFATDGVATDFFANTNTTVGGLKKLVAEKTPEDWITVSEEIKKEIFKEEEYEIAAIFVPPIEEALELDAEETKAQEKAAAAFLKTLSCSGEIARSEGECARYIAGDSSEQIAEKAKNMVVTIIEEVGFSCFSMILGVLLVIGAIIGLCCCLFFGKVAYTKFNEEEDDGGAPVVMVQHMRSTPSEDRLSIATTGGAKNPGGPGSSTTSPTPVGRPGGRPGRTTARRTKKDNI